jgi:hypothetical protein
VSGEMAKIGYTKATASKTVSGKNVSDMISKKAYELYEKRGKKPGHALEDWLEAERIVKQKAF